LGDLAKKYQNGKVLVHALRHVAILGQWENGQNQSKEGHPLGETTYIGSKF